MNLRPNRVTLLLLLILTLVPAALHAGEAYTYTAQMGFSTHFSLIGGHYEIYVNAHLAPTFTGRNNCVFGGVFEQISPRQESTALGPGGPITGAIHYSIGPKRVDLPAGRYHLSIAAATNCRWRFTVVSDNDNTAGLSDIDTFLVANDGLEPADSITMAQKIHFRAQYRTDHDAKVPASGELQIWKGSNMIEHFPLTVDVDPETTATRCYVTIEWKKGRDEKYLGKDTAKFIVKIGGQQFTRAVDFTLTP